MTKIENQKKRANKTIWVLATIVSVLIFFLIIGKAAGWIGGDEAIKVAVAKAELQTIVESVTANGKIQPEVEVKISSDVSGEIRELYIKEGDSVYAGQILSRIDPELYQSALARSEAALNNSRANLATSKARFVQAEAKLTEMEKQFERNTKLYQSKLLSDAEFETAKSAFIAAKSEVEAGKQTIMAAQYTVESQNATLTEARKNLTRTEIFAPVNGVVSSLKVEKGERVVGTSQMAGTEMMRIANLNNMEVSVDVNENDIVKVSLGDTALIEVDAYGTRKFKGIVSEIANSATTTTQTTSDQVTNFVVKISILRSSYADLTAQYAAKRAVFRPGMSASVDIQTRTVSDAVAVPIEAVTMRNKSDLDTTKSTYKTYKSKQPNGKKSNDEIEVVFVINNNKVSICKVTSGIQNDKVIQITEGLKKGDMVVTAPFSAISRTLKQGTMVKQVDKVDLFEQKSE